MDHKNFHAASACKRYHRRNVALELNLIDHFEGDNWSSRRTKQFRIAKQHYSIVCQERSEP